MSILLKKTRNYNNTNILFRSGSSATWETSSCLFWANSRWLWQTHPGTFTWNCHTEQCQTMKWGQLSKQRAKSSIRSIYASNYVQCSQHGIWIVDTVFIYFVRRLPVPTLQDEGLIFLWVTGRAMELGRECLKLWGYERVDEIIWVKTNQVNRKWFSHLHLY